MIRIVAIVLVVLIAVRIALGIVAIVASAVAGWFADDTSRSETEFFRRHAGLVGLAAGAITGSVMLVGMGLIAFWVFA